MAKRGNRTAIKGGEWLVTINLEVNGEAAGEALPLRYTDAYLSDTGGMNVGFLIGRALEERAVALKPKRGKR